MQLHKRYAVEGTTPPVYVGHRPYKDKDGQTKYSKTYFYDFNHDGRKHSGPLKTKNKQAARETRLGHRRARRLRRNNEERVQSFHSSQP